MALVTRPLCILPTRCSPQPTAICLLSVLRQPKVRSCHNGPSLAKRRHRRLCRALIHRISLRSLKAGEGVRSQMQVGALILRLHITVQGGGKAGEVEGTDNFQYDFEQRIEIKTKPRSLLKRKALWFTACASTQDKPRSRQRVNSPHRGNQKQKRQNTRADLNPRRMGCKVAQAQEIYAPKSSGSTPLADVAPQNLATENITFFPFEMCAGRVAYSPGLPPRWRPR